MQLYTFAGEIDMEIAIASFRKSLPQWCCPSLQSDGAISVEEISHPLMADAIPNDFVLKKGVVLTGANASGKSTFMKAVSINVILAQTINTCVVKNICDTHSMQQNLLFCNTFSLFFFFSFTIFFIFFE